MDYEWTESVTFASGMSYIVTEARSALNTMSRLLQKPIGRLAKSLLADWEEGDDKTRRDFILSAADMDAHDPEFGLTPNQYLIGQDDTFHFRGFAERDIRECINDLRHCMRMPSDRVIELLAENDPVAERWLHDANQNAKAIEGAQPVYEMRQFDIAQGIPNGDWKPSTHHPGTYIRYAGSAESLDDANQLAKNVTGIFEYKGDAWHSEENPRLPIHRAGFVESAYTEAFFEPTLLSKAEQQSALYVAHRLHIASLAADHHQSSGSNVALAAVKKSGMQALRDSVPTVDASAAKLAMLAVDPMLHNSHEGERRTARGSERHQKKTHSLALMAVDDLMDETLEWNVPKMPLRALIKREDEYIVERSKTPPELGLRGT